MQENKNMHKILVVEDEENIRQVLCFFLRHSGYDVLDVPNGEAALHAVPEYKPDLVILDLMMPGSASGWDVLQKLHTMYEPMVPVIILTALVHFSDQIRGLEEGAAEYIPKPTQPMRVVERVNLLLSLSPEERLIRQHKHAEVQKKMLNRLLAAKEDEFAF